MCCGKCEMINNDKMWEKMKLSKIDKFITTTTVGELVKKLFDQDAYVFTEGCDCVGNVVDVSLDENDGTVLIERDDRSNYN